MTTTYICLSCAEQWPCSENEHHEMWSMRVPIPPGLDISIPCFVLDHTECTVAMFCQCQCHKVQLDEPSSLDTPPSNR